MMNGTASLLWENGTWTPCAGLPLSDRGYRHGMSVFETLRIFRGKLIALTEHLEKLRLTCAQMGLRLPPQNLGNFISPVENGIARLCVTAGDGHFRDPLNEGRILLSVTAASSVTEVPGGVPASLCISPSPQSNPFPGLKTGNYWPNIAAFRQAAELGADEMALINSKQHVVSASLANIFAVIDGLLLTPRVSSGARAGVTRDWVIAREDVIVSDFHPEQLRAASEIFLTNSGYGIAPIRTLEGRALSSNAIGEKVRADYQHWLEAQTGGSAVNETRAPVSG